MELRDEVLKALEVARNEKLIGKSLTAHVILYPTDETKALIDSIEEDMKQLLIVSAFSIGGTFADAPSEAQTFTKQQSSSNKQKENVRALLGRDTDGRRRCQPPRAMSTLCGNCQAITDIPPLF